MNKVIITGRLAADPELRRTSSDLAVTSFTVAVNRIKNKDGTQGVDWIDCVAWRNNAEFICKYFEKGKPILLEGQIQTRTYEDKDGNKRKAVELLVGHSEFFGGDSSSNKSGNSFTMPSDGTPPWEDPDEDGLPF